MKTFFRGTGAIKTAACEVDPHELSLSVSATEDGCMTLTILALRNVYIHPQAVIVLGPDETKRFKLSLGSHVQPRKDSE